MKNKEKAVGVNMSDSKTLHSLQVAKMSSDVSQKTSSGFRVWFLRVQRCKVLFDRKRLVLSLQIEYKKGSKESQAQYSLPLDMINLSHAKKAQALASDLEYRTKLHDYTVMPDDIKVQQAKKAYSLQSEVRRIGGG